MSRRFLFVAYIALAVAYAVTAASWAEPAPGATRPLAGLTDIQAARLLIRAGRFEHARSFLEHARPSGEEDSIERLFLLGRIEMRLGNPGRAAEHFEAILAQRPALTRVRLELAQAYYLAGRDDKAKYHFSASLADELPSSVEAAVEGFLRRIDARKRWSVSLSAAMLPDIRRPDHEEVLIGGVPFRLDEDARASSGVGALVSAGASFSPAITDDIRGVLAASAAAKLYERSDWNDTTVSGDLGLTGLLDEGSVSGGLRFARRWVGGDRYHRSLGPWTRARLRLSSSTRLDVALSAGYRTHDTGGDRDGWRVVASPRLLHVLDGRTSIAAEPMLEMVEAKVDHHGSRLIGFGATFSRAFDGGLSVSLSPSAQLREYAARDPLFGVTQRDSYVRLGVTVRHRSLRYGGFAPYIGFSLERNRSNIPVREYRSHGVVAGVSRVF